MNLGFAGSGKFEILPEDKPDAHHIALYMKLLNLVPDISNGNKDYKVLEIGCGRGGGCYVMHRYYKLSEITGVDRSPANIKLASRLVKGIKFIVGNANDFEIQEKYNLVVNLESSHAYASRLDFFRKVSSALLPGSYFAFGDLIGKANLEKVQHMFTESGLKILQFENINEGVINSVTKNSPEQYPLLTKFPYLFPQRMHNFSVSLHSKSFRGLKEDRLLYRLYLLQKV